MIRRPPRSTLQDSSAASDVYKRQVEELVKRGVKKLAIVAPAFLADGLETLEELDIGIREHFIELGGEELIVIKCLNDNQDWVEGLSKLVNKKFSQSATA